MMAGSVLVCFNYENIFAFSSIALPVNIWDGDQSTQHLHIITNTEIFNFVNRWIDDYVSLSNTWI